MKDALAKKAPEPPPPGTEQTTADRHDLPRHPTTPSASVSIGPRTAELEPPEPPAFPDGTASRAQDGFERAQGGRRPATETRALTGSRSPRLAAAQRTGGYELELPVAIDLAAADVDSSPGYQPESNTMKDVIRIVLVDPIEESRTSCSGSWEGSASIWLSEVLSSYQEAATRATEIAAHLTIVVLDHDPTRPSS